MDKQKQQYFANKKVLNAILDDVTLKRWKVLSKAYKQGKKIWGTKFTRVQLAKDMDMPITTVLRCLSLDRCNPKTWELIKSKKISAFKVAQITMSKNRTYQDEIVEMVIQDDLSTTQITQLKIKTLEDMSKERLRLACEEGFERKESAYKSFKLWLDCGKILLLMGKDRYPKDKFPEVKAELKKLIASIERYLQ